MMRITPSDDEDEDEDDVWQLACEFCGGPPIEFDHNGEPDPKDVIRKHYEVVPITGEQPEGAIPGCEKLWKTTNWELVGRKGGQRKGSVKVRDGRIVVTEDDSN